MAACESRLAGVHLRDAPARQSPAVCWTPTPTSPILKEAKAEYAKPQ